MTTVYTPRVDYDHFAYMVQSDDEGRDLFGMEGERLKDSWQPPTNVVIEGRAHPMGDTFNFYRDPLILTERAVRALKEHLESATELLPLPFESQTYWVVNVINVVDCLDRDKSNLDDVFNPVYVFDPARLGSSTIFKFPELPDFTYVTDAFKRTVEEAGLLGFVFEKLWSDED